MPYDDPRANQPSAQPPQQGANGLPPTTTAPAAPAKPKGVPKFSGNWTPPPATATGVGPVLPPSTAPIFPPDPPAAGPGGYRPTTAPFGVDQNAPGVREQFWNQNQNLWFQTPGLDWVDQQLPQFQDPWSGESQLSSMVGSVGQPGAGQQYWNGIRGQGNTPAEQQMAAGYTGGNNALSAFNLTGSRMPGSLQPQFDAYYDRMAQKNMGNVNAQSAARGAYGSSAALNGSIGAGLDAEALRAKDATDFSLKNSENQRQWLDSYANQGRNADLTGLEAFDRSLSGAKYGLDKTKTLGDLAFKSEDAARENSRLSGQFAKDADTLRRDRLDSGISTAFGSDAARSGRLQNAFSASGAAQDSQENRINKLYQNLSGFSSDVQTFVGSHLDDIITADGVASDAELETLVAKEADQRGWDQQQQERFARDLSAFAKAYKDSQTAGEGG